MRRPLVGRAVSQADDPLAQDCLVHERGPPQSPRKARVLLRNLGNLVARNDPTLQGVSPASFGLRRYAGLHPQPLTWLNAVRPILLFHVPMTHIDHHALRPHSSGHTIPSQQTPDRPVAALRTGRQQSGSTGDYRFRIVKLDGSVVAETTNTATTMNEAVAVAFGIAAETKRREPVGSGCSAWSVEIIDPVGCWLMSIPLAMASRQTV